MTVNTTVLYPRDAIFNLEYYIKSHMALVAEKWTPYGLKDWQVVQFTTANAPFKVGAMFTWDNLNGATAAMKAHESKVIFDDVPNFSDQQPILFSGDIVGSWRVGGGIERA
jgi:uncharacterized protein (TIGR02118 family)